MMCRLGAALVVFAAAAAAVDATPDQPEEALQCGGDAACPSPSIGADDDVFGALQVQVGGRPQEKKKCLYKQKVRVRREWRTLSDGMRHRVARAFWTLRNLSTEEGRKKYGPYFANYDEIVFHHACAVKDPRCDQGHNGPNFMTFHRLILLKTELALLAVDPGIEAMPYWDMAADSVYGKYYQKDGKYIFSDKYFGSFWGKGQNFEVNDGLFASWPIAQWSREKFGADSRLADESICARSEFFSGHKASTCIECCGGDNSCTCPEGSSLPIWLRDHPDCSPHMARQPNDPQGPQGRLKLGGTYDFVFRDIDFEACSKYPENVRSWMDWQNCQNVGFFFCFGKVRAKQLAENQEFVRVLRHEVLPKIKSQIDAEREVKEHVKKDLPKLRKVIKDENETDDEAHVLADVVDKMMNNVDSNETQTIMKGIQDVCKFPMIYGYYETASTKERSYPNFNHGHAHVKLGRDMLDLSTSPNDPGTFMGHHANVDRSSMQFQINSVRQDPELEEKLWYYPKSQSDLTGHGGGPPYAQSGPWSRNALTLCVPDKKTYPFYRHKAGPWKSGTLAGDVVNSGYPFIDLFNASCDEGKFKDCSGRQMGGYTHEEVIRLTFPDTTPYTYDTLEHYYC